MGFPDDELRVVKNARMYIDRAHKLADIFAKMNNYTYRGASCFVVNTMALSIIIYARDGVMHTKLGRLQLEPGDNEDCLALACADHFLDTRTRMSLKGWIPFSEILVILSIPFYDNIKGGIAGLKAMPNFTHLPALGWALDRRLREHPNRPLSDPNPIVDAFATLGANAGKADWTSNFIDGGSNSPEWFIKLYKDAKSFAG